MFNNLFMYLAMGAMLSSRINFPHDFTTRVVYGITKHNRVRKHNMLHVSKKAKQRKKNK